MKEYKPFGKEWEAEMKKLTKQQLIEMVRRIQQNDCLDSLPKEVEIELDKKRIYKILWENHNIFAATRLNIMEENLNDLADAIIKALPELIRGENERDY